jgi:murein DD-endopeptidase MepM/ murein hydrolase activator NlpD
VNAGSGGGVGRRRPPGARTAVDTSRLARMSRARAGTAAGGPASGLRRRVNQAGRAARTRVGRAARRGAVYAGDAVGAGWAVRAASILVERVGLRRLMLATAAAVAALCCLPAAGVVVILGMFTLSPQLALADCGSVASSDETSPAGGLAGGLAGLDAEQRDNAALIVEVGRTAVGAPPRAWVIAVATAMQESGLRNLPHLGELNDRDSLGLFQQRPSQGWGTAGQILDPVHATTAFYRALLKVDGWQQMALTEAAQAVQKSAYPDAYARHEPLAVAVVDQVTGGIAGAAATDAELACAHWHEVTAAGWTTPAPGPVWSGFRTANRPEHYGIDIGAPRGTAVRAAADGRVILVACNAILRGEPYSCDVDGSPEVTGCGWYANILHAGDVITRYCHLAARPDVAVGQQVVAGQVIGQVGSSGNSSGPHLHFEVELHSLRQDGALFSPERRTTDPVAFLAERGVVLECFGSRGDCLPVHGDRVLATG